MTTTTPALRSILLTGKIKAIQPLAHGGKNSGTVHTFRRETIFGANGEPIYAVPSISGGTIRYSLRYTAAKMMHFFLAPDDRLPFEAVHAMFNGGAMKETKNVTDLITGEKQGILRDYLPLFAVFGGMGGARSISGQLDVDSALPVTKETKFLAEHYQANIAEDKHLLSVYELVERHHFGRFSSTEGSDVQSMIQPESSRELPKGGGMLFWSQEVLPIGTELFHSLYLRDATPVEVSFFLDVYHLWSRRAHIGQQRRVGMGRISCHYKESITNMAGLEAEKVECNWREVLEPHKEKALEALSWL